MISFTFDLQLALHYDIPTYSVKIQTPPTARQRNYQYHAPTAAGRSLYGQWCRWWCPYFSHTLVWSINVPEQNSLLLALIKTSKPISPGLAWQRSCWSRCCCCWCAYRYDKRWPADDWWPGVPVIRQAAAAAACWYRDSRASCNDTGSSPNPGDRICPIPGPGRVGTLGSRDDGRQSIFDAPGPADPP